MVNKVTFVGFRGAIAPIAPLYPALLYFTQIKLCFLLLTTHYCSVYVVFAVTILWLIKHESAYICDLVHCFCMHWLLLSS